MMDASFITLLTLLYGGMIDPETGVKIGHKWTYDGGTGPKFWSRNYPMCNGAKQSPIDISSAVYDNRLKPFVFINYPKVSNISSVKNTITNHGHTVSVTITDDWFISGGNLDGRYKAVVMDFHWGRSDYKGSEHSLNSQRHDMELHVIHFAEKYGSLAQAINHPDGLAIIAVFVDIAELDNPVFDQIISSLSKIRNPGKATTIKDFRVADFMPIDTSVYYQYEGSMTNPPCQEAALWFIMKNPITISRRQINNFLQLEKRQDSTAPFIPSVNIMMNFRPQQVLNDRLITSSKPELSRHLTKTGKTVEMNVWGLSFPAKNQVTANIVNRSKRAINSFRFSLGERRGVRKNSFRFFSRLKPKFQFNIPKPKEKNNIQKQKPITTVSKGTMKQSFSPAIDKITNEIKLKEEQNSLSIGRFMGRGQQRTLTMNKEINPIPNVKQTHSFLFPASQQNGGTAKSPFLNERGTQQSRHQTQATNPNQNPQSSIAAQVDRPHSMTQTGNSLMDPALQNTNSHNWNPPVADPIPSNNAWEHPTNVNPAQGNTTQRNIGAIPVHNLKFAIGANDWMKSSLNNPTSPTRVTPSSAAANPPINVNNWVDPAQQTSNTPSVNNWIKPVNTEPLWSVPLYSTDPTPVVSQPARSTTPPPQSNANPSGPNAWHSPNINQRPTATGWIEPIPTASSNQNTQTINKPQGVPLTHNTLNPAPAIPPQAQASVNTNQASSSLGWVDAAAPSAPKHNSQPTNKQIHTPSSFSSHLNTNPRLSSQQQGLPNNMNQVSLRRGQIDQLPSPAINPNSQHNKPVKSIPVQYTLHKNSNQRTSFNGRIDPSSIQKVNQQIGTVQHTNTLDNILNAGSSIKQREKHPKTNVPTDNRQRNFNSLIPPENYIQNPLPTSGTRTFVLPREPATQGDVPLDSLRRPVNYFNPSTDNIQIPPRQAAGTGTSMSSRQRTAQASSPTDNHLNSFVPSANDFQISEVTPPPPPPSEVLLKNVKSVSHQNTETTTQRQITATQKKPNSSANQNYKRQHHFNRITRPRLSRPTNVFSVFKKNANRQIKRPSFSSKSISSRASSNTIEKPLSSPEMQFAIDPSVQVTRITNHSGTSVAQDQGITQQTTTIEATTVSTSNFTKQPEIEYIHSNTKTTGEQQTYTPLQLDSTTQIPSYTLLYLNTQNDPVAKITGNYSDFSTTTAVTTDTKSTDAIKWFVQQLDTGAFKANYKDLWNLLSAAIVNQRKQSILNGPSNPSSVRDIIELNSKLDNIGKRLKSSITSERYISTTPVPVDYQQNSFSEITVHSLSEGRRQIAEPPYSAYVEQGVKQQRLVKPRGSLFSNSGYVRSDPGQEQMLNSISSVQGLDRGMSGSVSLSNPFGGTESPDMVNVKDAVLMNIKPKSYQMEYTEAWKPSTASIIDTYNQDQSLTSFGEQMIPNINRQKENQWQQPRFIDKQNSVNIAAVPHDAAAPPVGLINSNIPELQNHRTSSLNWNEQAVPQSINKIQTQNTYVVEAIPETTTEKFTTPLPTTLYHRLQYQNPKPKQTSLPIEQRPHVFSSRHSMKFGNNRVQAPRFSAISHFSAKSGTTRTNTFRNVHPIEPPQMSSHSQTIWSSPKQKINQNPGAIADPANQRTFLDRQLGVTLKPEISNASPIANNQIQHLPSPPASHQPHINQIQSTRNVQSGSAFHSPPREPHTNNNQPFSNSLSKNNVRNSNNIQNPEPSQHSSLGLSRTHSVPQTPKIPNIHQTPNLVPQPVHRNNIQSTPHLQRNAKLLPNTQTAHLPERHNNNFKISKLFNSGIANQRTWYNQSPNAPPVDHTTKSPLRRLGHLPRSPFQNQMHAQQQSPIQQYQQTPSPPFRYPQPPQRHPGQMPDYRQPPPPPTTTLLPPSPFEAQYARQKPNTRKSSTLAGYGPMLWVG